MPTTLTWGQAAAGPSAWYLNIDAAQQPILYMPSTGYDAAGAGLGPPWVSGTTPAVTHISWGASYPYQFRRTRFSSSGGTANENLGVNFQYDDARSLWRGNLRDRLPGQHLADTLG